MNTITDYLSLPFIEVLKRLMKDAVKDCLAESEVLATFANASAKPKKRDPEGLTATEALEFLNENGYPMKKGSSTRRRARAQSHTRSSTTSSTSRRPNCLHGLKAASSTAKPWAY